ncbi:hypothetical protein C0991_008167, partial [Blastosporella zonata]
MKWKEKFSPARRRHKSQCSSDAADVSKTILDALQQSSDAFPPLKSVACAVSTIWDISVRVKSSKKEAKAVSKRCIKILEVLADSVPDPSSIPPEMLSSIEQFERLLNHITDVLRSLEKPTLLKSLIYLNRTESTLQAMQRQLDEVSQRFLIASSMRIEAKVSHTEEIVISDTRQSSAKLNRI